MDPNFTRAVLGISDSHRKAIDVGHLILTSPGLSANETTKGFDRGTHVWKIGDHQSGRLGIFFQKHLGHHTSIPGLWF
jgi:hypothetical protein